MYFLRSEKRRIDFGQLLFKNSKILCITALELFSRTFKALQFLFCQNLHKINTFRENQNFLKQPKKNLFKIGQKWAIILRRFIFWEKAELSENALKKGFNEFKMKQKEHKKFSLEIFLSYEQAKVQILSLFCPHLSFEKRVKMRPNMTVPFPRK